MVICPQGQILDKEGTVLPHKRGVCGCNLLGEEELAAGVLLPLDGDGGLELQHQLRGVPGSQLRPESGHRHLAPKRCGKGSFLHGLGAGRFWWLLL